MTAWCGAGPAAEPPRPPGLHTLACLRDGLTAAAKRFGDLRRRRRGNVTDPVSTCGERSAEGAAGRRAVARAASRSGEVRRDKATAAAARAGGVVRRGEARAQRSGDKGERSEAPSALILRDRKIPPEILVYKRNGAPLVRQRFFPSTPVSPCSLLHRSHPMPFCGLPRHVDRASKSGNSQADR